MRYIDSHFHLNHLDNKGIDIPAMMQRLQDDGFIGGLDIGVDPTDMIQRFELLKQYPFLHYSVGLYPSHAEAESFTLILDELEDMIRAYHPHALGEIGLDYHWDFATPEKQQELCILQIKMANSYKLPVIIHNRDADYDMLTLLKEHKPKYGIILHCYSVQESLMEDFIKLDAYLSFAGNLTYKNSKNIQTAARVVPLDHMLLETDSPYLAPIPKRGKLNTPEYIPHTYEYAAQLRQMETGDLSDIICDNFQRLFPPLLQK